MTLRDPATHLNALMWSHIAAKKFAEAEPLVRRLIDSTETANCLRLWNLFGVLAGVLTELQRLDEATDMLRRALGEARRTGKAEVLDAARYMLANHHLVHGDPR